MEVSLVESYTLLTSMGDLLGSLETGLLSVCSQYFREISWAFSKWLLYIFHSRFLRCYVHVRTVLIPLRLVLYQCLTCSWHRCVILVTLLSHRLDLVEVEMLGSDSLLSCWTHFLGCSIWISAAKWEEIFFIINSTRIQVSASVMLWLFLSLGRSITTFSWASSRDTLKGLVALRAHKQISISSLSPIIVRLLFLDDTRLKEVDHLFLRTSRLLKAPYFVNKSIPFLLQRLVLVLEVKHSLLQLIDLVLNNRLVCSLLLHLKIVDSPLQRQSSLFELLNHIWVVGKQLLRCLLKSLNQHFVLTFKLHVLAKNTLRLKP